METKFFTVQDAAGNLISPVEVTVYVTNSATKAAIFDADGVALPNPFTAGEAERGRVSFAAPDGIYDIVITARDGQFSLTRRGVQIVDLAGLLGGLGSPLWTPFSVVHEGDGTTRLFSLPRTPLSANLLDVSISGVTQADALDYVLKDMANSPSGTGIEFTEAPHVGERVYVRSLLPAASA